MTDAATYRKLLPTTALLCVILPATWLLLARPHSLLFAWTGVDFHYLALPVALGSGLLLLNRLLLLTRSIAPGREDAVQLTTTNGEELARRRHLASVPLVITRLGLDVGWMVLALSLLSSVALLPSISSAWPGGPELDRLADYVGPFRSLAGWGAVLLLIPLASVRAAAEAHPFLREVVTFSLARLIAFGMAYLLLADGGVLSVALDVQGSKVLWWLGAALGMSYGASTLRAYLRWARPVKRLTGLRAAQIVMEGAWIAALLGSVAALPSAVEPAFSGRYPEHLDAYLAMLESLLYLVGALLLPLALLRAAGVFRPVVDQVIGFPITHLALLAVVHVLLSRSGVLATAFDVNPSQAWAVMTQALALSYGAMVLRNLAGVGLPGRFGRLAARSLGFASPVAQSGAWTMAVLVTLNHLPVANAVLLGHTLTRSFGEDVLPHFGGLFEARYTVAGLCLVTALALSLPKAQADGMLQRYSSLLAALAFGAAGYLAWTVGTSLVSLGHGFVLGGALSAAGMYALAISHLAAYATDFSNRTTADLAGWLSASKARAFALGVNAAFYVLLLRPVLYEYLWLAPLYEYAALLVLMLVILMRVLNHMRKVEEASGSAAPVWTDWSHHRQALEEKADRRTELAAVLRRQFVENGEWKPLWTYLMGLLYRSGASLDSMREACRPLRNNAIASSIRGLPGAKKRNRARRSAALEESLKSAERALASPAPQLGAIHEDALREAATPYVESGAEQDAVAMAFMSAHCQRGDDLRQAVDRWFHLLDVRDPTPGWFMPRRRSANVRQRERGQRVALVEGAIAHLFADTVPRDRAALGSPA